MKARVHIIAFLFRKFSSKQKENYKNFFCVAGQIEFKHILACERSLVVYYKLISQSV